ncbi:thioredoxin-disulfide reductase [Candidatus Poribacteria bacterium]|nr:thioredoxin-disulfide reductase [Candidatus Poribacteria bacterium]
MYDLIILGGGPAGLTAGLYGTRSRLDTLLLEKAVLGGKVITTEKIENYPGFPDGINGPELMEKMEAQAKFFGLQIENASIEDIQKEYDIFKLIADNNTYYTKTIIIATGTSSLGLGIPGEEKFKGRGVSYCATCDALFFKNKPVIVVGGGDAACEEGIYLTKFASHVYIIHRRDKLRATKVLQERALANPKIEFIFDSVLEKIEGNDYVEKVIIKNIKTSNKKEVAVEGIFLYIGTQPNTDFLKNIVNLDEKGYIITDDDMRTETPGIFAAGDVRKKMLRQVSTAVGDGATAAYMAEKYIESKFKE